MSGVLVQLLGYLFRISTLRRRQLPSTTKADSVESAGPLLEYGWIRCSPAARNLSPSYQRVCVRVQVRGGPEVVGEDITRSFATLPILGALPNCL